MANEKRFLVLSLKWWQKLQPKWRRGENLTLDRSTTMTFPNPASPTLCHKIYFTVIHLGWARRDCQTQLDTSSNHPTFETSKQPAPWEASTCRIMWYKEFHSKQAERCSSSRMPSYHSPEVCLVVESIRRDVFWCELRTVRRKVRPSTEESLHDKLFASVCLLPS